MCLLAVLTRRVPEVPLLVLANRDERRDRPAAGPAIHRDGTPSRSWLGGTDLSARGTWLGVNASGLVVAVTNRPKSPPPVLARSRGLLCRELLACATVAEATDAALESIARETYAGFNLFLGAADGAVLIECVDEPKVLRLEPGIHVVANGGLNDPDDDRLALVREELERAIDRAQAPIDLLHAAGRLCARTGPTDATSICRTRPEWGTVSSTLIALADDAADARFLSSPGPPHEFAYADYSPLLRQLLEEHNAVAISEQSRGPDVDAAPRVAHRIRLKGPWEFLWTPESPAEEVRRGTIQVPHDWSALAHLARGTLRLSRRFHKPTNLGDARVSIVLDGLTLPVELSLDGLGLDVTKPRAGAPVAANSSIRADITERLREVNEIGVALRLEGPPSLPLWEQMRLEIAEG